MLLETWKKAYGGGRTNNQKHQGEVLMIVSKLQDRRQEVLQFVMSFGRLNDLLKVAAVV